MINVAVNILYNKYRIIRIVTMSSQSIDFIYVRESFKVRSNTMKASSKKFKLSIIVVVVASSCVLLWSTLHKCNEVCIHICIWKLAIFEHDLFVCQIFRIMTPYCKFHKWADEIKIWICNSPIWQSPDLLRNNLNLENKK